HEGRGVERPVLARRGSQQPRLHQAGRGHRGGAAAGVRRPRRGPGEERAAPGGCVASAVARRAELGGHRLHPVPGAGADGRARAGDAAMITGQLSDDYPVLLGPVRLETRFTETELLVRVFPDDWCTEMFEPRPTAAELAALDAYWTAL